MYFFDLMNEQVVLVMNENLEICLWEAVKKNKHDIL